VDECARERAIGLDNSKTNAMGAGSFVTARYAGAMPRRYEQTWGFRLEPREWLRLARLVRENPGDVTLGARVFFAIGGHDEEPAYRRLLETAMGRHLVENAVGYPELFTDYERLRALPPGTLGREYVRDLDERGIDPVELDRLTQAAYEGREFSPEHAYVRDRVRHAHDLFHTLTGYGVDVFGEAGVLAFTYAQTGNKGWAGLVFLNGLTAVAAARFDGWLVAWKGYQRGRRARFLPAVDDWERLLRLPIEEARAELGIPPLEPYAPMQLGDVFRFASDAP
jgi:ubiquinone biosynthesis protein COQ4